MNLDMITIDDLCAGLEEAAKEDEKAKSTDKIKEFVAKFKFAFEEAYQQYKTSYNVNARSPQTKQFKEWMYRNRDIRNLLIPPFNQWARGCYMYYDHDSKEIYWDIRLTDGSYINIPRFQIRSRDWSFRDLDNLPPPSLPTGVNP